MTIGHEYIPDLHYLPGNRGGYRLDRNTPETDRDRDNRDIPDHRGNIIGYFKGGTFLVPFNWQGSEKIVSRPNTTDFTGGIPDILITSKYAEIDITAYFGVGGTPLTYKIHGVPPWVLLGNRGIITITNSVDRVFTGVTITGINNKGRFVSNTFNIIIRLMPDLYVLTDAFGTDLMDNNGNLLIATKIDNSVSYALTDDFGIDLTDDAGDILIAGVIL